MTERIFKAYTDANGIIQIQPQDAVTSPPATSPVPIPPISTDPINAQWLGTNLGGVVDWQTDLPFTNHLRHRRPWALNGSYAVSIARDVDGNPTSLKAGETANGYVFTTMRRPGIYILKYKGTKPSIVGATEGNTTSASGLFSTAYTVPASGNVSINVTANDTKLISLVASTDDETQEFHPDFVKRLGKYGVVRFMDWQQTNVLRTNLDADFLDAAGSYANYQEKGPYMGGSVPLPVMIRLANKANVNPWFCIPVNADATYITKFVQMVAANLKSNLKAYFEHSNEVWNGQFPQSAYMAGTSTVWADRLYNHALRTSLITDTIRAVMPGRSYSVLGAWCVNSWWSGEMKRYLVEKKKTVPDFVAIGAYFGNDPQLNDSVNPVTEVDAKATLVKLTQLFADHQTAYGAGKVIAYEGGSHIMPGANTSKQAYMESVYDALFSAWKAKTNGAVFCHFNHIGAYDYSGAWGEKETFDSAESPKSKSIGKILGR